MFQFVTLPDGALRRILDQLDEKDLMNIWIAYKVELKLSYDMRNCPKIRKRYDEVMLKSRKRKMRDLQQPDHKKQKFSILDIVNPTFWEIFFWKFLFVKKQLPVQI